MNEVTFFAMTQARFPHAEISHIIRLGMATDTASILFMMLISPLLLRLLCVRTVINLCGVVWILTGAIGLIRFLQPIDVPQSK